MQTSEIYCRNIVRSSGSTFALAFRTLNADQIRAMRAVYAFCRIIDDIVDSQTTEAATKRTELDVWRARIGSMKSHVIDHPLIEELDWTIRHFGVNTQYMEELIDGCARDINPVACVDHQATLRYCYGVAGTVGLMCLPIFGVPESREMYDAAISLSRAFQLTNMIRDVRADVLMGRVYLPLADWRRFRLEPSVLLQDNLEYEDEERIKQFIQSEVLRARQYYTEAWEGFARAPENSMAAAKLMSKCYEHILNKIAANPLRVVHGKVGLNLFEKIYFLLRGIFS